MYRRGRWLVIALAMLAGLVTLNALRPVTATAAVVSRPVLSAGPATIVGQLAGQATPGVPVLNDTTGRANFHAGDLGIMWDDGNGHTMVAYGDSYGAGFQPAPTGGPANNDGHLCNALARSGTAASSLFTTMSLSFVTSSSGAAEEMLPCSSDGSAAGIIPTAGVSVNGVQYVDFMHVTNWGSTAGVWQTSYAELAQSTDDGQTWTALPSAQWANSPAHTDDFQQAALVSNDGYVYLFGTPNGRFGNAYLARVPASSVGTASDYQYWTGTTWQTGADTLAAPVVSAPVAELSVQYNVGLGLWLMTYLDQTRNAIVLRYARSPEGPWSGQQVIVQQSDMPSGTFGIYGGFMHPWSTASDLYLTVSAWYPYQVYLMHVPLSLTSSGDGMNLVNDGAFDDPMDGYAATNTAPPAVYGWSTDGQAGIDVGLGNGHGTPDNGWARSNVGGVFNDLYQTLAVVPDQEYTFSVWIRTSSTNNAAYVGVRNAAHTQFWQAGPIGVLGSYTEYRLSFNSGANSQVQVYAGMWPQAGVDTWIQVDQFQLIQTPLYTYVDAQTGRCLDSNSAGSVYTLPCNGGAYQLWYQVSDAQGSSQLVDTATGRCLDSNSSGSAYTLPCNGGNYQEWHTGYIDSQLRNSRTIVDNATGRCLDSNSAGSAYTLPCNGGAYQLWS